MILTGRIIDCTGADPIEEGAVLVKNGRIVDVGKRRNMHFPEDETVLNAPRGKTIIPGMIDFHNHYVHERPYKWYYDSPYGLGKSTLLAAQNAKNWINAGITTVRDYSGNLPGVIALRDEINAGRLAGPRTIFVSSHSMPGKGPEEIAKKAKEIVDQKVADWLGISATGGFTDQQPNDIRMTLDEVLAVAKVAHSHGKKLDANAENPEAVKFCCEAGADCITHGMLLDDDALEMIKKRNIYWSPILLTRAASCELDLQIPDSDVNMSGLPQAEKVKWIETMKNQLKIMQKNVKKAYEMGIKILPGSDIPPPREEYVIINPNAQIREVELLMKWSGMSPMEALMATTKLNGEALGMPIGTLEKGKIADIVVVNGDPLKNLREALDPDSIWLVMKDGKTVVRKE